MTVEEIGDITVKLRIEIMVGTVVEMKGDDNCDAGGRCDCSNVDREE